MIDREENKFKVDRVKRKDGMVEYRVTVSSVHVVDEMMDESVPSKYLATYVVNRLREFVAEATFDGDVEDVVRIDRDAGSFDCPVCRRPVDDCFCTNTTDDANDDIYTTAKCGACGVEYHVDYHHFNYCPSCGRRVADVLESR